MKIKIKLLRAALAVVANALIALGIGALAIGPTLATTLTITPLQTQPPRQFNDQVIHYLRFTFNYNQCVLRAADTACSIRVGSLPYNAFLVAISKQTLTLFNPTTSATVALGTAAQSANIMTGYNVFAGTTAVYDTTFAGAGELVTGNGITATGANGGFDVWATYTPGAALTGTQGQVVFVIQYIAPNDGSCSQSVPLGGSAAGC